jgi:hypothetical protein
VCSAQAATTAAADRIGKAFSATERFAMLGSGETVEIGMPPIQQNRIMLAEQKINAELKGARCDLQHLSRLQNAAQEV